jgi:hypothetical protein
VNMIRTLRAVLTASLVLAPVLQASAESERQSLEELRNTVINLLQGLVDQGVLTREKAQAIVKQAQEKAAADAAASAKADEGAVRVPYVPQVVKDEISKQVAEQVKPEVVASVVQEAKTEKWGVPGALPEWLSRVKVYGDVTLRAQEDLYDKNNSNHQLFDYFSINQAGSFTKAGVNEFINTTQDRDRLRLRARLGVDAQISPTLSAGIRLASGSLTDPGSESQNLGTYAARYTVGIDRAFILWNSSAAPALPAMSAIGGRFANPWFSPTELVFARDLQFEGVSSTGRLGFGGGTGAERSHVFVTVGAFPLLEVPLANPENKWMVGGQLGTNLRWADGRQRLSFAAGYYDFLHVSGVRNTTPDSTVFNYTAPAFIRQGNTYFDIADSSTNSVNLFALAAHFRVADIAATYDIGVGRYVLGITGEAVRNVGYNRSNVEALSGQIQSRDENRGYVGEISFGDRSVDQFGRWRARVGYRYVMSDAVIDAWTDADFHEGGTNTAGYYVWGEFGVAKDTWLRLRYMSGNEIDGPAYGLDVIQFDLNTRF